MEASVFGFSFILSSILSPHRNTTPHPFAKLLLYRRRKKAVDPVSQSIPSPWHDFLAEPLPRDHVVQLYDDERVLVEAVALYAGAGIGKFEAAVIVATPAHLSAIELRLAAKGFIVEDLKSWGQLTVIDAASLLARFMIDDTPDPVLFSTAVGEVLDGLRASGYRKVRVYGEMVNLLWRHNVAAAARLEELWNDLIRSRGISLLCAYQIDPDAANFPPQLTAPHSHLIPLDACSR
jgi:hypothetical protein